MVINFTHLVRENITEKLSLQDYPVGKSRGSFS